MRFTEIILTLPTIILLIVAVSMLEVRSSNIIMIMMAVISWPWMARTVRSEFLQLKESNYVEAAKSLGASDFRIIFRHILPNAMSPIIVLATIDLAWFILYQATLAFLGLADPTEVSWGIMINLGRRYLRTSWWVTTFPGLAIFFSTLGFNLLGDGLRDALDVKTRY
jgi:peptide/nickel transport system permease protein